MQREEGSDYEQHIVLRAYALALLIRESEDQNTRLHYFNHIAEQAAQFDELQPEEWHKLDSIIPHIEYVGDALAANYSEDENLHEIALQFALNIKEYLARRREVKREA